MPNTHESQGTSMCRRFAGKLGPLSSRLSRSLKTLKSDTVRRLPISDPQ